MPNEIAKWRNMYGVRTKPHCAFSYSTRILLAKYEFKKYLAKPSPIFPKPATANSSSRLKLSQKPGPSLLTKKNPRAPQPSAPVQVTTPPNRQPITSPGNNMSQTQAKSPVTISSTKSPPPPQQQQPSPSKPSSNPIWDDLISLQAPAQ